MKGELDRTLMIYVDSYDNSVPVGRFHIASDARMTPFGSLSRLLIGINDCLDKEKFPQSFTELRKFRVPVKSKAESEDSSFEKKGAKATFAVRLLFRQNASWQRMVRWIEGGQEEYFRSALELVMLMDDALGHTER